MSDAGDEVLCELAGENEETDSIREGACEDDLNHGNNKTDKDECS